jgi:hypothetical protein
VSKQKKGVERQRLDSERDRGPGERSTSELFDHDRLGNQALAARLGDAATESAVPFDVIRDSARPMLDRALLAVEIRPVDPSASARYLEILASSLLPEAHRQRLVDKLVGDQAVASGVSDLLARHFEGEEAEVRFALGSALDAVWDVLDGVEERETAGNSVGEKASRLIGDLAESAAPELRTQAPSVSAAVTAFCRALFLATYWDEEEEEEDVQARVPELDS